MIDILPRNILVRVLLLIKSARLIAKGPFAYLLRGALVLQILLVGYLLVGHEPAPEVALATPVSTPKQDQPASTVLYPTSPTKVVKTSLVRVPVVEVSPIAPLPTSLIAAAHEAIQFRVVHTASLPTEKEPEDDRDDRPVVKKRKPPTEIAGVDVKLKRYCARPGKSDRSWIRVLGVKHYCAS